MRRWIGMKDDSTIMFRPGGTGIIKMAMYEFPD
jgi:hypothetical protein